MVYRKKYSGTDRPRKMETPTIKRLRMEFMLVNCRKDRPTAAEIRQRYRQSRNNQSACRLHPNIFIITTTDGEGIRGY
jgi:hypothetical protein